MAQNDVNEELNITTRFRVKDEYKNLLRTDRDLRGEVIEDLAYGVCGDWEDASEYPEVFASAQMTMLETVMETGPLNLYSDLGENPAYIKVVPNKYFEVEYMEL